MRSNPPTNAPDSSDKKLILKERTIILFEKKAKKAGLKAATLMKNVLDEAVAKDEWTLEDEEELHRRIIKNMKRNEKIKARYAAK